jgi:hypothetical protein
MQGALVGEQRVQLLLFLLAEEETAEVDDLLLLAEGFLVFGGQAELVEGV